MDTKRSDLLHSIQLYMVHHYRRRHHHFNTIPTFHLKVKVRAIL